MIWVVVFFGHESAQEKLSLLAIAEGQKVVVARPMFPGSRLLIDSLMLTMEGRSGLLRVIVNCTGNEWKRLVAFTSKAYPTIRLERHDPRNSRVEHLWW